MEPHNLLSPVLDVKRYYTNDLMRQAFSDWLARPTWAWDWYITQTFDGRFDTPSQGLLKASWRNWMKELNVAAMASYGFVFGERGKFGRLHWHALVHVETNLHDQPRIRSMWEWALERYGRNTIFKYRAQPDVYAGFCGSSLAKYLTKYVAKDVGETNLYWDFTGFISGREADAKQIGRAFGVDMDSTALLFPGNPTPGEGISEDDIPF